jgi:diguanylate cyclase (GGDEF)-like protein
MAVADIFNSPYVSPRLAARFPARSLLGLPLIADGRKLGAAFMSFNRPHTFTPEEIDIARQAADQIALAVEKARLLESERERSALLTRANALILALGHVAAKIESASDPDEVMSTLGSELHKLNIECLIALVAEENEELGLRYISLPARVVTLAEKIAGVKMRDFPLSRERFYAHEEVIGRKQAVYSGLENVMGAALPGLAANLMRRFIRVIGVSGATRVILLPLVAREKILGTLWMWGNELKESDLPAANVFASQVAISLENARLYREIQRLAITDELTGLYNRRGIMELGQREFNLAARYDRPLSAVLIDIDHFKNVNDSHGHAAGDQVLRVMGEQCRQHVRGTDLVGRFGGEELLLLLPETKIKAACEAAERLRTLIEEMEVQREQSKIKVTISLGVAERKGNMEELAELIHRADEALYAAKEGGRNRVAAK